MELAFARSGGRPARVVKWLLTCPCLLVMIHRSASAEYVAGYGCRVNFRDSASVGFAVSANWRLLATVDHISNAGLCKLNRGRTHVDARLGYKLN